MALSCSSRRCSQPRLRQLVLHTVVSLVVAAGFYFSGCSSPPAAHALQLQPPRRRRANKSQRSTGSSRNDLSGGVPLLQTSTSGTSPSSGSSRSSGGAGASTTSSGQLDHSTESRVVADNDQEGRRSCVICHGDLDPDPEHGPIGRMCAYEGSDGAGHDAHARCARQWGFCQMAQGGREQPTCHCGRPMQIDMSNAIITQEEWEATLRRKPENVNRVLRQNERFRLAERRAKDGQMWMSIGGGIAAAQTALVAAFAWWTGHCPDPLSVVCLIPLPSAPYCVCGAYMVCAAEGVKGSIRKRFFAGFEQDHNERERFVAYLERDDDGWWVSDDFC
ncbi:unnamed protein product [Amoebophrya sp. A120]|nr:unnamed protein product [Amoebophrya sp. A120]|eukprot:GSA120T00023129001.1